MADADTESLPHYDVEITPISSVNYEELKRVTIDALTQFQNECKANLPDEFTNYLNALMGEIDLTHKAHEMDVEKASATVPTEQNPKTVVLDIKVGEQSIKKTFKIIETGGGGDCLFSTLVQLLKTINKNEKLDVATIRTQIVKKVVEKYKSQPQTTSTQTELNLVDTIRNNLNFESSNTLIKNATTNSDKKNIKVNGGVKISGNKILFIDRVVTVTNNEDIKYVSEDNSKNYESIMNMPGTYGTEVEIIGAVLLYQISICVCISTQHSKEYQLQYYIYTDDDTVRGLGSDSNLPSNIQFIYNTNNNHYQYLEEVK